MDIERIEELIKVLQGSTAQEISVCKGDVGVSIRKAPTRKAAARPKGAQQPGEQAVEPQPQASESYILAPMVGIFHKVNGMPLSGSRVEHGDVVGTIESMKLLNDVVSRVAGVLGEILVDEGTPVEYGQPLCRVEPDQDVE